MNPVAALLAYANARNLSYMKTEHDMNPSERKTFWTIGRVLMTVVFVSLTNLIAAGVFFFVSGDLQQTSQQDRRDIFINRAQSCKVQVALGVPLDDKCQNPDVLKYYDPVTLAKEQVHRNVSTEILCFLAEEQGASFREVCG